MATYASAMQRIWPWIAILALLLGLGECAEARVLYTTARALDYTGDGGQLTGDIVYTGGGAAAVLSRPEGFSGLRMMFYRFGLDGAILAEKLYSSSEINFYTPDLCWDGANYGVVASTLTQAVFMILSPAGELLRGPQAIPGIPNGGRTAAFRIYWTGNAYAVFGLWLEKSNPYQDITSGNFYTHLHFWLLDGAGQALVHKEIRMLAPITYPGVEGFEKVYYDVAPTAAGYFLAYYSESETGPPLSTYYVLLDAAGNTVRAEQHAFVNTTAMGAVVAGNGRTVALTALKQVVLEGNHQYLRCFDIAGNPRAPETEYGSVLGFGPSIMWEGDKFLTAYCSGDPYTGAFSLRLNAFDEMGSPLCAEYSLDNGQGGTYAGTMGLGIDLQLCGDGHCVFAKAQTSNYIVNSPLLLVLSGDGMVNHEDVLDMATHWQAPFDAFDLMRLMNCVHR